MILTEHYLKGETGLKWYLVAICMLSFFGDAYGTVALVVGIIFVVFYSSIQKKRIGLDVILIVITPIICQLVIFLLLGNPPQKSGPFLKIVVHQLLDYKELSAYFIGALSKPLFDLRDPLYCSSYGNTLVLSIIVMLFTLSVFVVSIYILLKNRDHEWTIVPTLLIMYLLLSMFALAALRLPVFEFTIGLKPRYTRIYEIGFLGCLLTLAQSFSGNRIQSKIFLAIIFSFVLTFSSITTYSKWKYVGKVIEHREKWHAQLVEYAVDKSVKIENFDFSCPKNNCEDSIDFLHANKLSLFSE